MHSNYHNQILRMSELDTNKLAELIDKRHRCLSGLLELSTMQSELIAGSDMPALMRTFAAKNQWVVGLQAIERELAPYHQQDPETRRWASVEARERCAAQATECKTLLDRLMKLEVANEEQMTQRRDQVANRLQSAQSAGTARTAYQSHQQPHAIAKPTATTSSAAPNRSNQLDITSDAT